MSETVMCQTWDRKLKFACHDTDAHNGQRPYKTPANDGIRTKAEEKTSGPVSVGTTERWERRRREKPPPVPLPDYSLPKLLHQGTRVGHNPHQELGRLPLL